MTPEEAGQRLLEGQLYVDCVCEYEDLDCPKCQGWNVVRDPTYIEALEVLGMKWPKESFRGMSKALQARKDREG